jgi:hypothetical protein
MEDKPKITPWVCDCCGKENTLFFPMIVGKVKLCSTGSARYLGGWKMKDILKANKPLKKTEDFGLTEQEAVMETYKQKGFVLTEEDEQGLHMSFSPYRVKKGLTKLQVRRRINKYFRDADKPKPFDVLDRVEVRWNGHMIFGVTMKFPRPENSRQLNKLLKLLVKARSAPKKPAPKGFF